MLALQAWRSWRNAKGVALVAAAALAIGIGSATAIYTVVNAIMLKPLPYRDGERFVALLSGVVNDPGHYGWLSSDDARAYRERTQAFDVFGWFRESGQNLTFAGEPHHVAGVRVTTSLVHHLGVSPVIGQWFHDDRGVVLSNSLWRRLGSDPDIVGKPLTLDGRGYTVTGVMPGSFRLPVAGTRSAGVRTDLWMALDPREDAGAAYVVYARRRPGVSLAAAEADVTRVAADIAAGDPANHPAYTAGLFDLQETVVRDVRPTLLLLFGAAGLLFLITCANAAGLLLARSVARARETAMRVALGARRGQLAAQYFVEGLPIALAGALGGIVLSVIMTPAIVSMTADYVPSVEAVKVDWRVLLFALGAAMVATLLSSLAPLWQAVRAAPVDALGDGARASEGMRSRRISRALVTAEIALAFALLAASAVLLLHLRALTRTSPGFEPDHALTFVASIPGAIAADAATRVPYQQRLVDELRTIPGVEAVAFANQLPLVGCCLGTSIYPEGRGSDLAASQRTSLMAISPDYLGAMRIPLRRGRWLTDRDVADDRILAVISEGAARRYWGDRDPIGAYARFVTPDGARLQVVGIVGDVKNDGLGNPSVPDFYILSRIPRIESMHFVVRSDRSPEALIPDIRRVVKGIDPELPIHSTATFQEIIDRTLSLERAASLLTMFFAGAALLMAMLGVYGVMSYAVRQRTVEIGTRMALGATPRGVLSLVVGGGLQIAAVGVIAGGALAVAAAFYLRRVLEIDEFGPAPIVYSTSIIGIVAVVASFVPAWRASLLSPIVAIRNEPTSLLQAAHRKVRTALAALSDDDATPEVPLGALIGEFADSLRRVASFQEATDVALARLRERLGAQSIALLERTASNEYRGGQLSVPEDGFLLKRLRYYPHPLTFTESDLEAWLAWAREPRPEYVDEIETLRRSGARVAVPLRTKHEIVGVLLLGPPEGRAHYTTSDKHVLSSSADVFALMIENARLTDRALEQEKLRRDLALAAEVQRRLLPPNPPRSAAVSLAAFTLPARSVGGDYYDFLDLGDGRIGIAVADVAGKGIAAALLMSVVQASLRVISSQQVASLSQLAARMNGFLHQSTGANKYATFFYAELDQSGSCLRYVNAGHNPPYLVRCENGSPEIVELSTGGTVLGLFEDMEFQEAHVDLRPGDFLAAFTDGVTEALNSAGEEFGEERLKALLREASGGTADDIATKLVDRVRDWIGDAEQHDDVTLVVAAVNSRLS